MKLKTWYVGLAWCVAVCVQLSSGFCHDVETKLEQLEANFQELQQSIQYQASELARLAGKVHQALQIVQEAAALEIVNSLLSSEADQTQIEESTHDQTQSGGTVDGQTQGGGTVDGQTQGGGTVNDQTQVEEDHDADGSHEEQEGTATSIAQEETLEGSGEIIDDEEMENETSGIGDDENWYDNELPSQGSGYGQKEPKIIQFLTVKTLRTEPENDEETRNMLD